MSIALTSGMPPPSSVASVRAACDVENFRAIGPEPRQLQHPAVEPLALRRLFQPRPETHRAAITEITINTK